MKVLWVIKGLGPGGAEQLLLEHARAPRRDDIRYEAAYLVPWKNHLVPELEAEGVVVHPLRAPREADPRWLGRLRRIVRERDIDVVHLHSPYVAALARPTLRLAGPDRPALVYTEHNMWDRHRPSTRFANRATLRLDDHTVAVSEAVRATMGPAGERVEVLLHGIDVAGTGAQRVHRDEVRAELDITGDETVIGTVANYRREKAYPDLLRAARQVLDERPDVRFVAVGQGPLEDEIRAEHARLGLGDRFQLLGYRPDAVRVMSAFDVFTLASHQEGLPIALLDALALGLPVVATDVGGISTAVTPGVEGELVAPGRPAELASALSELVADRDRRSRASAAALERAGAFDRGRAVERLEAIYAAVDAERRGRRRPSRS